MVLLSKKDIVEAIDDNCFIPTCHYCLKEYINFLTRKGYNAKKLDFIMK